VLHPINYYVITRNFVGNMTRQFQNTNTRKSVRISVQRYCRKKGVHVRNKLKNRMWKVTRGYNHLLSQERCLKNRSCS